MKTIKLEIARLIMWTFTGGMWLILTITDIQKGKSVGEILLDLMFLTVSAVLTTLSSKTILREVRVLQMFSLKGPATK